MAALCQDGIPLTKFMRRSTNCIRYAFCGWLAECLTESQSWLLVFVMGKLRNPRRERFAIEVASMVPVDRAYLAAGFRSKPEWSRPNGSKLAHVPEVANRISELRDEFKANCALSVEYLQAKLLPAAEANVVDFLAADGKLKPIGAITRDQGAAISSLKFHENGEVAELKLISKEAAIGTLLRSIGAIVEQHQHLHAHQGLGGLGDRLDRALARARLTDSDQRVLVEALEQIEGDSTEVEASS
jgi:hypothetical protein